MQTDKQLRVRQNDGELEKPGRCEDGQMLGDRQDTSSGGQHFICKARDISGNDLAGIHHALKQGPIEQACLHTGMTISSREQQDLDVALFL